MTARPPLRLLIVDPEPDEDEASRLAERIMQLERAGEDSGDLRAKWREMCERLTRGTGG
jgi:hypothetical protein